MALGMKKRFFVSNTQRIEFVFVWVKFWKSVEITGFLSRFFKEMSVSRKLFDEIRPKLVKNIFGPPSTTCQNLKKIPCKNRSILPVFRLIIGFKSSGAQNSLKLGHTHHQNPNYHLSEFGWYFMKKSVIFTGFSVNYRFLEL